MRKPNPDAGLREQATPLTDMECACCGKVFCPAPYHVYRDGTLWFCKWTCYNAYLNEKENRKRRGKGETSMAINGKQKGKRGELELARKFREYGFEARRSVQYNGKEEEGQADVLGLPGIHIECKRTEKLYLYEAVDQAKRDSKGTDDIPVVFHRKNNCEWLAILPLDEFMKLYAEYGAIENEREQNGND